MLLPNKNSDLIFYFFKFLSIKNKLFVYINMIDKKFQSKLKKITQKNKNKYHIRGGTSFKIKQPNPHPKSGIKTTEPKKTPFQTNVVPKGNLVTTIIRELQKKKGFSGKNYNVNRQLPKNNKIDLKNMKNILQKSLGFPIQKEALKSHIETSNYTNQLKKKMQKKLVNELHTDQSISKNELKRLILEAQIENKLKDLTKYKKSGEIKGINNLTKTLEIINNENFKKLIETMNIIHGKNETSKINQNEINTQLTKFEAALRRFTGRNTAHIGYHKWVESDINYINDRLKQIQKIDIEEEKRAKEEADKAKRKAEEAKRKAEEEEKRKAEEEAKRKAEEEAKRKAEEEEKRAKEADKAKEAKLAEEEADKAKKKAEEAKRKAEEEKKAEEEAVKAEEEKKAEEEAVKAEEAKLAEEEADKAINEYIEVTHLRTKPNNTEIDTYIEVTSAQIQPEKIIYNELPKQIKSKTNPEYLNVTKNQNLNLQQKVQALEILIKKLTKQINNLENKIKKINNINPEINKYKEFIHEINPNINIDEINKNMKQMFEYEKEILQSELKLSKEELKKKELNLQEQIKKFEQNRQKEKNQEPEQEQTRVSTETNEELIKQQNTNKVSEIFRTNEGTSRFLNKNKIEKNANNSGVITDKERDPIVIFIKKVRKDKQKITDDNIRLAYSKIIDFYESYKFVVNLCLKSKDSFKKCTLNSNIKQITGFVKYFFINHIFIKEINVLLILKPSYDKFKTMIEHKVKSKETIKEEVYQYVDTLKKLSFDKIAKTQRGGFDTYKEPYNYFKSLNKSYENAVQRQKNLISSRNKLKELLKKLKKFEKKKNPTGKNIMNKDNILSNIKKTKKEYKRLIGPIKRQKSQSQKSVKKGTQLSKNNKQKGGSKMEKMAMKKAQKENKTNKQQEKTNNKNSEKEKEKQKEQNERKKQAYILFNKEVRNDIEKETIKEIITLNELQKKLNINIKKLLYKLFNTKNDNNDFINPNKFKQELQNINNTIKKHFSKPELKIILNKIKKNNSISHLFNLDTTVNTLITINKHKSIITPKTKKIINSFSNNHSNKSSKQNNKTKKNSNKKVVISNLLVKVEPKSKDISKKEENISRNIKNIERQDKTPIMTLIYDKTLLNQIKKVFESYENQDKSFKNNTYNFEKMITILKLNRQISNKVIQNYNKLEYQLLEKEKEEKKEIEKVKKMKKGEKRNNKMKELKDKLNNIIENLEIEMDKFTSINDTFMTSNEMKLILVHLEKRINIYQKLVKKI